jgi:hypothetical protein
LRNLKKEKEVKKLENEMQDLALDEPSYKNSLPLIAGIILIIAGVISAISWIPILSIDESLLETVIDITEIQQQVGVSISIDTIKDILTTCAIIGIILSIFPILGGLLSIKRKLWGIALTGAIIGLVTFIPMIIPGVLCVISMIFLVMSRHEFNKVDDQEKIN